MSQARRDRQYIVLTVAALAMAVAACGGRSATTTAAPTTTAPTTAEATTAAPVATTAPPSTTTSTMVPPSTDVPILEAIQAYAGTWQGQWTNSTFESSGPVEAILEVFDDGTLAVSVDLGGAVFGSTDPDPERWILNAADLLAPVDVSSATFGELTLILSTEGARLTSADVPADGIASFQLDAQFDIGPRILGTYLVGLTDGSVAEGNTALERIAP